MVKPEWGTKRACPKCNTRFYDLGKEDPVTCIACGNAWAPEPYLKSKQPLPFEQAKPEAKAADGESLADDDLDIEGDDEEAVSADDDLGDDEDDIAEVVPGADEDDA